MIFTGIVIGRWIAGNLSQSCYLRCRSSRSYTSGCWRTLRSCTFLALMNLEKLYRLSAYIRCEQVILLQVRFPRDEHYAELAELLWSILLSTGW